METLWGYGELKEDKGYHRLICANFISILGVVIYNPILINIAYETTGSPIWKYIIMNLSWVSVIVQPLAGVIIDRVDKKKCIVICDLSRGLMLLLMGLLYYCRVLSPWALIGIALANVAAESVRHPCELAITSGLLPKSRYGVGISLNQSLWLISEWVGSGLVLGLLLFFSPTIAAIIGGGMFLGAAVVLNRLHGYSFGNKEQGHSYGKCFAGGFLYFGKSRILAAVTLFIVIFVILQTPWKPEQIWMRSSDFNVMPLFAVSACLSAGHLIGLLLFPLAAFRVRIKKILINSGILMGILFVVVSNMELLPWGAVKLLVLIVSNLLFGLVSAVSYMAVLTTVLKNTAANQVGRTCGIFYSIMKLTAPLGLFVTAVMYYNLPWHQVNMLTGTCVISAMILLHYSKLLDHLE